MGAGTGYNPAQDPACPYEPRMTRAEALALRAAGDLLENCVVVITDGPTIGTAGNTSPTEIELNPTSPTELGLTARVHTDFDDSAWAGLYDIDLGTAGSIIELTDNWGNTAKDIDADAPTVQTQVPWHAGAEGSPRFRDNYFEDTVLTGWDNLPASYNIHGNTFKNTTHIIDPGAGPVVTIQDCLVEGTGTHRIGAGDFNAWRGSVIKNATVDWNGPGRITMTDSQVIDGASVTSVVGNITNLSVTRSVIEDAAVVQYNTVVGGSSATLANMNIKEAAEVIVETGAMKSFTFTSSTIGGRARITQTGGTVTRSMTMGDGTEIAGRAGAGDSILHGGDVTVNMTAARLNNHRGAWSIDGQGTVSVTGDFFGMIFSRGATANGITRLGQVGSPAQALGGTVTHNGAGDVSLNNTTTGTGSTVRTAAGTTGSLSLNDSVINGGIVAIDSGARSLSVFGTTIDDDGEIIQTGVGPSGGPAGIGDRVDNCFLEARGKIHIQDTVAVANDPHQIFACRVRGVAHDPNQGRILINGTSNDVYISSNEVLGGILTVTDAPIGALDTATSMYNNQISGGSSIVYTGGDAVAKQVRDNRLDGNSALNLNALTGAAGGGLADVFGVDISGQSTVNVSGARVVGQPVRNTTVQGGSLLTVSPNGTVLQCRFGQGANLTTGAFRHSESIIEGAILKTATAANVNRLASKAFDDWI